MENKSMAMTPEQISVETNLHINTVYFYLKTGRIPNVKLARRYLVSRLQFENFLAGQSSQPPAAGVNGS